MRTRCWPAALLFHILFSFIPSISAQSSTTLTGFVYDQNGAPIAGASVRFTESDYARTAHNTLTDDTGLFLFENVSGRRGQLTVDAPGFRQSLIVLTGAHVEIQIVLLPKEVGGTVTITRTKSRIEETASSILG